MSNVKQVHLTARIPYNIAEYAKMQPFLAQFAGPIFGLQIDYTPGGSQPNENGGKTAFYFAEVFGAEAVSWKWIDAFKEAVTLSGGEVVSDDTIDLET